MTYDRIVSSRPVNKTSARVLGRGVHWAPAQEQIKPWMAWQDTPLPVSKYIGPAEFNIVGMKCDRLTVVGYSGQNANNGSRWVVRCTCGKYGHQSGKYMRSETAKTRAKCPDCDYLVEMVAGRKPAR